MREVEVWFNRAVDELDSASILLAGGKHASTVLHCQQSAELALKALWIHKNRGDVPKTHSLVFLGHETDVLANFGELLRELTPAYIDSRYPDAGIEDPETVYGGDRARLLFVATKEFIEWIQLELQTK